METLRNAVNLVSYFVIPVILVGFPLYGLYKRVPVYESFVEGAKEGFQVAVRIIPYLVAILSRFDLFTIWSTVLVGIGVAVMARRSRGQGFTAAGLLWLVASLWTVLSAFRQAAAMGG